MTPQPDNLGTSTPGNADVPNPAQDDVAVVRQRVALCEDSIHPAAVWYREDVARLSERITQLERERDGWRDTAEVLGDENAMADLLEDAEARAAAYEEALRAAYPILVALAAWKDNCGHRMISRDGTGKEFLPAHKLARDAKKLARRALDAGKDAG